MNWRDAIQAAAAAVDDWPTTTAPSMNGFTSAIAAIKIDGVKRTLPSPPPRYVYVAPDVVRQAPPALIQAGYCDVMAKSVSDVDWQVEYLLAATTARTIRERLTVLDIAAQAGVLEAAAGDALDLLR